MTVASFAAMYNRARQMAELGVCMVLVPGYIDGTYVVVSWAWAPDAIGAPMAISPDPRERVGYLADHLLDIRESLEQDFDLGPVEAAEILEECAKCHGHGRVLTGRCTRCKGVGYVPHGCDR